MILSTRARPVAGRLAVALFAAAVASVLLTSLCAAQAPGAASPGAWRLLVSGAKADEYLPPSCHPLAYFSGPPKQFDYESGMWGNPESDSTYTTTSENIGAMGGRQIVEVDQHIHPTSPRYGGDGMMKRVLVERRSNDYCMIFQEQDFYDRLFNITQAGIVTVDGEPMLWTDDAVRGNGGLSIQYAWIFPDGAPAPLDPAAAAAQALKRLVPAGCSIRGEPWSLPTLTLISDLWRPHDCHACASCGSVAIQLGFKNHKLVVIRANYNPLTIEQQDERAAAQHE